MRVFRRGKQPYLIIRNNYDMTNLSQTFNFLSYPQLLSWDIFLNMLLFILNSLNGVVWIVLILRFVFCTIFILSNKILYVTILLAVGCLAIVIGHMVMVMHGHPTQPCHAWYWWHGVDGAVLLVPGLLVDLVLLDHLSLDVAVSCFLSLRIHKWLLERSTIMVSEFEHKKACI